MEKIIALRPKSLEFLTLNHIRYIEPDDNDGWEFALMDGWEDEVPLWTANFTHAQATALQRRAKGAGVKLGSHFRKALESQRRYEDFLDERDMEMGYDSEEGYNSEEGYY